MLLVLWCLLELSLACKYGVCDFLQKLIMHIPLSQNILGILDSGALVSLNLANNNLGVEGAQHLAKVLPRW